MNYPKEHREFHDWLETNQPGKAAIALWHALMGVCNKARWPQKFTVAISVLESKTGFKRSELFEARKVLQTMVRIRWANRGGNLAAEYEIIPFCVHTADTVENLQADSVRIVDTKPLKKETVSAIRTLKHTQKHTQTGTINKHKQNKEESSAAEPPHSLSVLQKRELAFAESLKPFIPQYGDEMVQDFCEYWTEPNKSGTLMKWEMEKTWDVKRRLNRWRKNQKPSIRQKPTTNHATANDTAERQKQEKHQQRTRELQQLASRHR